ncbi:hypothetical protein PC123_g19159 [Phytophthora cactorum]|nr:hypothetical protein PC123_g19159 [Phytophthora cactorum]
MPPPWGSPQTTNVFEYLSRRFSLGDRVLDKRVYNQLESRLLRRRCTVLGWCSPSLRERLGGAGTPGIGTNVVNHISTG